MSDYELSESWLAALTSTNELSDRVVANSDRWDQRAYVQAKEGLPLLADAAPRITDQLATGEDLLADVFAGLFKVAPDLLGPEQVTLNHQLNQLIMSEAAELPQWADVRRYSVGDPFVAGLGVAAMVPELETLHDRYKHLQEEANESQQAIDEAAEAQQRSDEVDEMMAKWAEDGGDPDSADFDELAEQLTKAVEEQAEAEGKAETVCQRFAESLEDAKSGVSAGMRQALGAAADAQEADQAMCKMFGTEPGDLRRMDAKRRIALAKRMENDRTKAIMALFGSLKTSMDDAQAKRVDYLKQQIEGIEIGNDLQHVLPIELARMDDEDTYLLFLKDFVEGALLQYRFSGYENLERGALIMLKDESESMEGAEDEWATAFMLVLMHLARQQNRAFHVVHFGIRSEILIQHFVKPEDFTPEAILDAAEHFWRGGTNFQQPLKEALTMLQDEFDATGKTTADVVFLTDGEAPISESLATEYHEEEERMQFRTFGVNVGGDKFDDPLYSICSKRVTTVRDVLSGGDVRDIFQQL
jgi:uncharacterized protein with von Willebrand factor type A (vWA) domain